MSTPRKQWNPDTSDKELEDAQQKQPDQRSDPRDRPEIYRKNPERVVTSDPGRREPRKDG